MSAARESTALQQEHRDVSKSLAKGLEILKCFTAEDPLLRVTDISARLGVSRSSSHRYASTLLRLGYLEQDSQRRYRLGLRAADLGISVLGAIDLRRLAQPHLRELRRLSRATVSLAVLDGTQTLLLDRLLSSRCVPREIDALPGEGTRAPAHATAPGKVMIALLSAEEQASLLAEINLAKLRARTISNRKRLLEELSQIRQTGVALEYEELSSDMCSIARAIYTPDGQVLAAVGLTLPCSQSSPEELMAAWSQPLLETSEHISAGLSPG